LWFSSSFSTETVFFVTDCKQALLRGGKMDCIFCQIIEKKIPAKVVFENEEVLGFKDLNPAAPQHLLFIPKKHVRDFLEAAGEPAMVGSVFAAIREYVKRENLPEDGIRVVSNCGASAGQSVFHWHVHVLGGRKMTWPPG
jgi:histidine triad (HIT) family protein